MNTHTYSIGPIMKAARKFKKFNQADVAQAIGCSQSALSKMEHNLLVPSAPQWFLFSRFTSIPPETLETGIIDRHSLVKFNSEEVSLGFKIPKKYRSQRAQKARELYPFMQFLQKERGADAVKDYIAFTGIDSEFFLDFDNLINFQLLADTVQYFLKAGFASEEKIAELVKFGQNDIYWNHYGVEWRKLSDPIAVLQAFVNEQLFFQTDFQLRVEQAENKITLNYLPEFHLKQFKETSPELVNFLNTYRKHSLQNLMQRVLGREITVDLHPEGDMSLAGKFLIAA